MQAADVSSMSASSSYPLVVSVCLAERRRLKTKLLPWILMPAIYFRFIMTTSTSPWWKTLYAVPLQRSVSDQMGRKGLRHSSKNESRGGQSSKKSERINTDSEFCSIEARVATTKSCGEGEEVTLRSCYNHINVLHVITAKQTNRSFVGATN